jgi:membrane protease YdiL (CAAX protease family)
MTQPSGQDPIDSGATPPPSSPFTSPYESESLPPAQPPQQRFYPLAFILGLAAWCVIAILVVVIVFSQETAKDTPGAVHGRDDLNLLMMRFQARYILGIRELAGPALVGDQQIYAQASALDVGPIDQRLRFVVLAGELRGPEEALKKLDKLEELIATNQASVTPEQKSQRETLRQLYVDYRRFRYDAPSVSAAQKQDLRDELDWFGDLALVPAGQPGVGEEVAALAGGPAAADIRDACPDPKGREAVLRPALRAAWITLGAFSGALGLFLLGCCGLLVVAVLLYLGKSRVGLNCATAPAGVYVETFALWLSFYFGLGYALKYVDVDPHLRFPMNVLLMLSSLATLLWPVVRGVPWRQVREHVGLTLGRRPLAEPAIGVGCYIMGYPLMFVGLALTLLLIYVQHLLSAGGGGADELSNPSSPAHPIVAPLASGNWLDRLEIFVLASIVAPLVEETVFRGVLYRHLRQLTQGLGILASVIFSGLISSFIFAVIHPQGLLAVPVLMSLAFCFVLAREWRGTLVPCMVAHGVSNGAVLLLTVGFLS